MRLLQILLLVSFTQACQPETNTLPDSIEKKANIILIMTDDQGVGDVGYMNNPFVKTPNIDQLAEEGLVLQDFYVSPVCAPTRASLMSGKQFIKTGVYDTYNGGAMMDTEVETLAEHLKEQKYRTAVFGKWHLGDHYPMRPMDQGFDVSLTHKGGGVGQPGDADNFYARDSSYFNPILYKNGVATQTQGYCSDVYTDAAIDFIRQQEENPFFLYLSFNAPHTPLQLPGEYYDMYKGLEVAYKNSKRKDLGQDQMSKKHFDDMRRVYGMVTNIDDNIGRLLLTLQEKDLRENTLIIFMTDNGPQQYRYRNGYRGLKSSVYQGGVQVPCIFNYSEFEAGSLGETLAHIDMLPTLVEFAGGRSSDLGIDGKSFLPLLQGKSTDVFEDRSLFFHWQRNYPEKYRNIAIMKNGYKLVGHAGPEAKIREFELFNLKENATESENLIEQEKDRGLSLKKEFDDWYEEVMLSGTIPQPKIIIGSEQQTETLLTRNDAKGHPPMWGQENVYGYWEVEVAETGYYDIEVSFLKNFAQAGRLTFKMAPYQTSVQMDNTQVKAGSCNNFYIKAGSYKIESWFQQKNRKTVFPFTIRIKKSPISI